MALDGSRAKLRRAKEHFDTLAGEIEAFFEPNPYTVVVERPVHGLYVVRVKDVPIVPGERWALLIGDCVHNLRCALDYLAWEAAGANPADTQTQFPIFDSPEGWRDRGLMRVAGIKRAHPEVAVLIETLQPYATGDPRTAALNALRKLDDADKHKLLTVTVVTHKSLHHKWSLPRDAPSPDFRANVVTSGSLECGAILSTLVMDDAPPEMEVQASFAPRVAFSESLGVGYPLDVIESLPVLIGEVDAVISAVEKLIGT